MTENQQNELLFAYAHAEHLLEHENGNVFALLATKCLMRTIKQVLLIDGLYGSAFDQEIAQRRMLQGNLNSEPLNAAQ